MSSLFVRGRPEEAAERLKSAARILRLTETDEDAMVVEIHDMARALERLAGQLEHSLPGERRLRSAA